MIYGRNFYTHTCAIWSQVSSFSAKQSVFRRQQRTGRGVIDPGDEVSRPLPLANWMTVLYRNKLCSLWITRYVCTRIRSVRVYSDHGSACYHHTTANGTNLRFSSKERKKNNVKEHRFLCIHNNPRASKKSYRNADETLRLHHNCRSRLFYPVLLSHAFEVTLYIGIEVWQWISVIKVVSCK